MEIFFTDTVNKLSQIVVYILFNNLIRKTDYTLRSVSSIRQQQNFDGFFCGSLAIEKDRCRVPTVRNRFYEKKTLQIETKF